VVLLFLNATLEAMSNEASPSCIPEADDADNNIMLQSTVKLSTEGNNSVQLNSLLSSQAHLSESEHLQRSHLMLLSMSTATTTRTAHVLGWIGLLALSCCLCLCGSFAGGVVIIWAKEGMTRANKHFSFHHSMNTGNGMRNAILKRHTGDRAMEIKEAVDSGKLHEQYAQEYWNHYSKQGHPNLFKHDNLRIVTDAGMSDVPKLRVKYAKASFIVVAALLNFIFIVTVDVAALNGHGHKPSGNDEFLISKRILQSLLSSSEEAFLLRMLGGHYSLIVPLFELILMAGVVIQIVLYLGMAMMASSFFEDGGELQRWSFTARALWHCVPQLVYCSALRALHFVSPMVLSSDAYIVGIHAWEVAAVGDTYRHYAYSLATITIFVLGRIMCFVVGFDSFLVKFRAASDSFESGRQDLLSNAAAFIFVWQVMGIICLDWVVRDRLFIFMFGGEDGVLDIDEDARVDVWKALLTRRIYEVFGGWKGTILMLAFDDYDMQKLVLDDDSDIHRFESAKRMSESLSSSKFDPSLHALKAAEKFTEHEHQLERLQSDSGGSSPSKD
jgi:hypothetical protein